MSDFFTTIDTTCEALYREKGSKFVAYGYAIRDTVDVSEYLSALRSLHPKATHICYAYRLGVHGENYRANDDGEPSGTAGLPILNEITSHGYSGILIAVVRYYGGTKLGVPGLINAYKTVAKEVLSSCEPKEIVLTDKLTITCSLNDMGTLYNSIKYAGCKVVETRYDNTHVHISLEQRKSLFVESLKKLIAHYEGVDKEYIPDNFQYGSLKVELGK